MPHTPSLNTIELRWLRVGRPACLHLWVVRDVDDETAVGRLLCTTCGLGWHAGEPAPPPRGGRLLET